jgi:hypothetical protein
LVKQLLSNLLCELKENFEHHKISHPLRSFVLPVPSRWAFELQLQSEGYLIDGDKAVKKVSDSEKGIGRVLTSLFGEEEMLPPEGSVEDFLRIAQATLQGLTGWPSARAQALRQRVKLATATPRRTAENPYRTQPLNATAVKPPPPVPTQQPIKARPAEPPAWMQDFIEAHKSPGSRASRVTSAWDSESRRPLRRPTPAKPTVVRRGGETAPTKSKKKQEWMKDFESPPKPKSRRKHKSDATPEWMKDFKD